MRRWGGRVRPLVLSAGAFLLVSIVPSAGPAQTGASGGPSDPRSGIPVPYRTPPADPDADADEARRLEGDARGESLEGDIEDADAAAEDALEEALDPTGQPLPRRSARQAISDVDGEIVLGLEDAIRIGLERNLDLEVERFNPWIAYEGVGAAWGAYDPVFANEFGYFSNDVPNATAINANTSILQRGQEGSTGLTGLIPWWGASYEIGYEATRTFTNATIAVFSPQIDANVFGNITIPLLRDLVWNEAWTTLKVSKAALSASEDRFRTQVMDVVDAIERAYWAVDATREQLRVAEKSVETARALLDQTRTQYEVGVVSKVEVTEAEAGVAERDFNLIVASNNYRNAEDALVDAVYGPSLRAGSQYVLRTDDTPASFTAFDIDPEASLRKALANRPELSEVRAEIERRNFQLKFAENQALPQLDAVLSYGRQGQTGGLNPSFINPFGPAPLNLATSRSLADANRDFFTGNPQEQFAARGVLSIPIGNQRARSDAARSALELRQVVSQERRLEQQIVLEIRTAIRDLRSAQEGVVAAERQVAAAAEQLRAERIRLENGESTPFNVLLRERDLVDAESARINALRVYRDSSTGLDRAQGTILKTHNVRIEEVGALR